jgi:hypothetical protein
MTLHPACPPRPLMERIDSARHSVESTRFDGCHYRHSESGGFARLWRSLRYVNPMAETKPGRIDVLSAVLNLETAEWEAVHLAAAQL